jgi:hypothetical protein
LVKKENKMKRLNLVNNKSIIRFFFIKKKNLENAHEYITKLNKITKVI